jgi:hypothetical protein
VRLRALVLTGFALLVSCGPAGGPRTAGEPPERLGSAGRGETLHLTGELRGAFPGLGPTVDLEAWLRDDGWARVTIRSHDDEDRPTHEVLLWGPAECLLFNANSGRFAELGAGDGRLDALDNRFELRDAVFLLCGLDPLWAGFEPTEFIGEKHHFRGVRESGTLRRDGETAGIRWIGTGDAIHDIAVSYDDFLETDWGAWPRRIEVTGTDLAAAARLHWNQIDPIVVLGDSIFDPLWEPAPR